MKKLIVYYSMTGNNDYFAKDLKRRLKSDILEVREKNKRGIVKTIADLAMKKKPNLVVEDIGLEGYDTLIFIAPVWGDGVALPMKAYMEGVRDRVKGYAFASLCLGTPNVETKLKTQLPALLGSEPESMLILKINDLLPDNKKNSIKASLSFRIQPEDYVKFESLLDSFVQDLTA